MDLLIGHLIELSRSQEDLDPHLRMTRAMGTKNKFILWGSYRRAISPILQPLQNQLIIHRGCPNPKEKQNMVKDILVNVMSPLQGSHTGQELYNIYHHKGVLLSLKSKNIYSLRLSMELDSWLKRNACMKYNIIIALTSQATKPDKG